MASSASAGRAQPATDNTGTSAGRLRAALGSGGVGASQPDTQELVNAILRLGHLPLQSRRSSAEENRLAAGLVRAQKAGTLSSQQESQLRALDSATRAEDSGPSAQPAAAAGDREQPYPF